MDHKPSPRVRQQLALLGMAGVGVFALGLVALHAASFHDPPSHMSQFANSPFALLWVAAIYSLLGGSFALVWALRPCLRDCRSKRVGLAMLALAWVSAALLAVFPADAFQPTSWRGTVHDDAALTTFVLLGAAMVVLTPAFRASPGLARFSTASLVLGVLVTLCWIAYLATTLGDSTFTGPVQRFLVALIIAWFAMLAQRLRGPLGSPARNAPRTASRASRVATRERSRGAFRSANRLASRSAVRAKPSMRRPAPRQAA